MATDSDPTHNLVDDLLAEMAAQPATRLLITSENWGWWGRRPISYGIIERWLINGFFVRASDTSKNLWDLSDRARDYLAGKIPRSEIKWPEGKRYVPPPPKFADESGENAARPATTPRPAADLRTFSEADELFTDSGVCRLCGKVSHVFGMISHAKSKHGATYEDTGEVQLVTRRKKTVAIILGGAPASVPVGADATPAAKAPTAPKSKPAPKPAGPIDLGGDITQMSPDEILRRLGVKK